MAQIDCLLLSTNSEVQRVVKRISDDLRMKLEVRTVEEGASRLREWRFDAIILDGGDSEFREILREIRKGKRNRTSIVLAVVEEADAGAAFNSGANFALGKPVKMERFSRLMHAAHSLIVRQRLRYHRHAVQIRGSVSCGSVRDFSVTLTNLSEGGAQILVEGPVVICGPVSLRFTLPDTNYVVEAKGEVVWANAQGRAGIRFVHPLAHGSQQLLQWLSERIHPEDLGVVSNRSASQV